MRKLIVAALIAAVATPAMAQVRVRGYVRSDGTYVAPHVRSAPNSSTYDNWSTSPNINPYNGRQGTVDPSSPPVYRPHVYTPPVYTPPATTQHRSCTYSIYC